jgi:RNA polymerase sigma-70 factor (ECF subfamily)
MVRDRHRAEDIFQEVAMILWRKFPDYNPEFAFGAWARGIALRKIMQTFEKDRKAPVILSPQAMEAIARFYDRENYAHDEREQALQICIDKLSPKARRLIDLRYRKGLKLREMAQVLERKLDAVHKTLSRIRIRLRECIERQLVTG